MGAVGGGPKASDSVRPPCGRRLGGMVEPSGFAAPSKRNTPAEVVLLRVLLFCAIFVNLLWSGLWLRYVAFGALLAHLPWPIPVFS